MRLKLKTSLQQNKTLLILSLVCLLLGTISILLGDLVIPAIVAVLALIFIFDLPGRQFSIGVSIALIILNILAFIFELAVSLFAPEAIILAFVLSLSFCRRTKKSETVLVMCLTAVAFTALTFIIIPFALGEASSFVDVRTYYNELIESIRTLFVSNTMELYSSMSDSMGVEVTEAMVESVFNAQISLVISYVTIAGFALVGVSMKLFEFLFIKIAEEKSPAIYWRFHTSNVFAYFYVALILISIFVGSSGGVFGIAIGNLYNIFMVVYAYVGLNALLAILTMKFRPLTSVIILILALVVALSLTLHVSAAFGVLFTIRKNRELTIKEE